MQNLVNSRKLNLNFSTFSFTLIKSRFELNNFNHLPVIKEEEGYFSEGESELSEKLLKNTLLNKNYPKKKINYESNLNENFNSSEKIKVSDTFIRLPPLVNINCLMNTDVKQTKAIWDTNFGKRLINGKNAYEHESLIEIKQAKTDTVRKSIKKSRNNQKPIPFLKIKSIQEQNAKNVWKVKANFSKRKESKESKGFNNASQNSVNTPTNKETDVLKSLPQIHSTESFQESMKKSSNDLPVSKNQRFLTECVKSILNKNSSQINCEYCSESFSDIEELCNHKKQHEVQKETCLLCEKVFYNPNEFIQHLLTHESVDHVSCKKCKRYFPNLKKYKEHCQNFHLTLPARVIYKNQDKHVEKWLPKFECKRYKVEFDCEKLQKAHRRNHNKSDLKGVYFLGPKNM